MGYVSRDMSLWYNMGGIVAAYQPVRANDPLIARYNVANGGSNAYRAEDVLAPTWSAMAGWTFNGSTQYLSTGIYAGAGWSWVVRYVMPSNTSIPVFGSYDGANRGFSFGPFTGDGPFLTAYWNLGGYKTSGSTSYNSGVAAAASQIGYHNGNPTVTAITAWSGAVSAFDIHIGGRNQVVPSFCPCTIYALAICARTLSAAEVFAASRQMAYCDVNPDWSAWGRRREWWYAKAAEVSGRPLMGDRTGGKSLYGDRTGGKF